MSSIRKVKITQTFPARAQSGLLLVSLISLQCLFCIALCLSYKNQYKKTKNIRNRHMGLRTTISQNKTKV